MKVSELLEEIYEGKIVLPDFQRSFIWEPEDVRELIVSILGNYFIGSMLILETIKDESSFALRFVEGVEEINSNAEINSITKVLLDGQQRATSIFYALYEPSTPLKGRKNPYKFYINLKEAIKGNWDEAVIEINDKDRKRKSEILNEEYIIPLSLFRDIGKLAEEVDKQDNLRPYLKEIIKIANNFMNYEIHIVTLPRETDLYKIVETFERINRTGEPLSVFDLLCAKLYKYDIKLRDLWEEAKNYEFTDFINPEYVLKVIALIRKKEPKRKNILELEGGNFKEDWKRAINSLESAYKRITDTKGYGVLNLRKWMPYSTMIVPLAAILDFIKNEKLETSENYNKIDRWYWASVFLNSYDQAVDSISYRDYNLLKEWIIQNKTPEFIERFNPEAIDLTTDKKDSATYRGVINLIVLKGALDFKTGQPPQFEKEKLQDDHIFPKSIYNIDEVANRTLISTNAEKSNKKPSEYFNELIRIHRGRERLCEILKTHLISEKALENLLNDDVNKFIEERKKTILSELVKIVKGLS